MTQNARTQKKTRYQVGCHTSISPQPIINKKITVGNAKKTNNYCVKEKWCIR